jgi:hypothetical protein
MATYSPLASTKDQNALALLPCIQLQTPPTGWIKNKDKLLNNNGTDFSIKISVYDTHA